MDPIYGNAVILATREPGTSELVVTLNPALPLGIFTSTALIHVVDLDGRKLFGMLLPIGGDTQPEVRMLPSQVLLGLHPIGAIVETTVSMNQVLGDKTILDRIEMDTTDLAVVEVESNKALSGRRFLIRQKISHGGDCSNSIKFHFATPTLNDPPVEVIVRYRGETVTKKR